MSAACEFVALDLPSDDGKLYRKYNMMVMNKLRRKDSVPPPVDVPKIIRHLEYNEEYEAIARKEYEETGKWFFVRSEAVGGISKDDASATSMVYRSLGTMDITKMPNYSAENHQKAIEYWQSWQHPGTGVFINPRIDDPQNPDPKKLAVLLSEVGASQKSNASVMGMLGADPIYPPYLPTSSDDMDLDELWDTVVIRGPGFKSSAAGKQFSMLNARYERGERHLIYLIENFISTLVRRLTPESGMTKVDGFHDYPNSENSLKLMGRVVQYRGVRNLPYMKKMVDTLLTFRDEIRWGGSPGCARNYTELLLLGAFYHDYRRDEVIEAVEYIAEGIKYVPSDVSMGYRRYNIALASTVLNWDGIEPAFSGTMSLWGLADKQRYFMGPYGRWLNMEDKEPHEIIGHPDFDFEKYGLETENAEMEKRIIYNKCKAIEPYEWYYGDGETVYGPQFFALQTTEFMKLGHPDFKNPEKILLKKSVVLDGTADYQCPFLKVKFKGAFDIFINGVLIMKVLPENIEKEWNWCGFYIRNDQRHALRDGINVISVVFTDWTPDSYISVGVIDWY